MTITYIDLAKEITFNWKVDPDRLQKALDIVAQRTAIFWKFCPPGCYDVRASSKGWYRVDTRARTCTCEDSTRGNVCKHRIAVWIYTQQIARTNAEVSHRKINTILKDLGYSS